MIAVDLFSGAGGLSLGASWAGVDVRLAVDSDPWACATYRQNFTAAEVLNIDVETLDDIPVGASKEARLLLAGPPCRGFSTSNQRTRTLSNPSNRLFQHFLRLASLWRPEWVLFENVKGILETAGGVALKEVVRSLERIGYRVQYAVLNAVDYEVPQKRRRIFVVGSLNRERFSWPEVSGEPHVTVDDGIADLPELENGASYEYLEYLKLPSSDYALELRGNLIGCAGHLVTKNAHHIVERYKHVPQGGNWTDIPRDLMANYSDVTRCHTGIYKRLEGCKPSVVLGNYRKNMLIHPTQHRGLSVREAARLQSFPDGFEFAGSIGSQQQQVANAVPPKLAFKVVSKIVEAASTGG